MVLGATNLVFIYVRKLNFNPCSVVALFVKNGTHGVAKTVPRNPACITNSFNHLIDAGLTHRLTWIIASRKQ